MKNPKPSQRSIRAWAVQCDHGEIHAVSVPREDQSPLWSYGVYRTRREAEKARLLPRHKGEINEACWANTSVVRIVLSLPQRPVAKRK